MIITISELENASQTQEGGPARLQVPSVQSFGSGSRLNFYGFVRTRIQVEENSGSGSGILLESFLPCNVE